jgi:hypothetical protein
MDKFNRSSSPVDVIGDVLRSDAKKMRGVPRKYGSPYAPEDFEDEDDDRR